MVIEHHFLTDTGRIKQTGDHGSILDITEARLTDSGMYICTASNTKSTVSANAHVIVQREYQTHLNF